MLLSKIRVIGHSMEPSIKNGSSVLVSGIPYLFSKPKTYDIVAFREKISKKIFVKRICKIHNEKYFVKGDNIKDSLDSRKIGWINRREIVGKVIYALSS